MQDKPTPAAQRTLHGSDTHTNWEHDMLSSGSLETTCRFTTKLTQAAFLRANQEMKQ